MCGIIRWRGEGHTDIEGDKEMIYCISQYDAERIGAALIERQAILEVILRYKQ